MKYVRKFLGFWTPFFAFPPYCLSAKSANFCPPPLGADVLDEIPLGGGERRNSCWLDTLGDSTSNPLTVLSQPNNPPTSHGCQSFGYGVIWVKTTYFVIRRA